MVKEDGGVKLAIYDATPTRVAVLHEDGTKTDVSDAKGRQLTFALGHEVIMGGKKIFSTHEIGNSADCCSKSHVKSDGNHAHHQNHSTVKKIPRSHQQSQDKNFLIHTVFKRH